MSRRRTPIGAAAVSVGLVALAASALTLAQSGQTPAPPTFRSGVNVVQIDVSVLDADRRPVRGLTAADFTVLENGRPREIVAFTPVDLPPPLPPASNTDAAWLRDVAPDVVVNDVPTEGRLVVIAFDWSIRFQDSQLARRIATETVNSLGPGDQAAVVFTSAFATAGVPQNFTADRERLLAAINQPMAFAPQGLDVVTVPAGGFVNRNGVMLEDPGGYASGDCRCRVCSLEAMTRVADAMRSISGRRKLMVFIGTHFRGYEPTMTPPRIPMRGLPPPPMTATQFLIPDSQGPGSCSAPLRDARREMEQAAGLANMTIHVVDPVGLETLESSPLGGESAETIRMRIDGLHLPADLTGGRTVVGTNAPEASIPDILAESQSYYLLGFDAADVAADGRLRRVEVKVNRPGVQVRARAGYYGNETSAARAAADARAPLLEFVEGTLPRTDVNLGLTAASFVSPGANTGAVALVLRVESPASRVASAGPGGRSGGGQTMRVAFAALDPTARLVASREQTVEFTSPDEGSGPQFWEILSRLDLAPGRYEIRAGTESSTGERGSVFTFVDVPDFSKEPFTLSGVGISAKPALPVAADDVLEGIAPGQFTTRRDFAAADDVQVFVQMQQARAVPEDVSVLRRIVDRAGREVFQETQEFGAAAFADGRSVILEWPLPLTRLVAGDYLATIRAATSSSEQVRNVRFSVK